MPKTTSSGSSNRHEQTPVPEPVAAPAPVVAEVVAEEPLPVVDDMPRPRRRPGAGRTDGGRPAPEPPTEEAVE